MLAGSVLFYNDFNRVIKEMDIEEFEVMSREEFFKLIINLYFRSKRNLILKRVPPKPHLKCRYW